MLNRIIESAQLTRGIAKFSQKVARPLPARKPKAPGDAVSLSAIHAQKLTYSTLQTKNFVDTKHLRVVGGNGGDGCISFLHLWSNEFAGPDGGDGGHGGHVIFQATSDVRDLTSLPTVARGSDGEKGT